MENEDQSERVEEGGSAEEKVEVPEEFEAPDEDIVDWVGDSSNNVKPKAVQRKEIVAELREMVKAKKLEKHQKTPVELSKESNTEIGKYLLRDIPLFKYEIFIYFFGVLALLFVYAAEKLELVEGMMGSVAFVVVFLPVLVWALKFLLYMPSKNRVPHIHICKSRVIELKVADISKGFIARRVGDEVHRMYITKVNRHTEASTGKPCVVTSDLHGENLDLLRDTKPDMRSAEFNSLFEMNTAVTTKNVMNRMLRLVQPGFSNPMFILLAINLAMSAFIIVKQLGILDSLLGP